MDAAARAIAQDPIPANGGARVLDYNGEHIAPKESTLLMARLNEKASQDVVLKRGTLWFVATALVLAGVIFSYGSSAIAWIRSDESQRVRLATIELQVQQMNDKLDKMVERQNQLDIQSAVKRGYELGTLDGGTGHSQPPKEK